MNSGSKIMIRNVKLVSAIVLLMGCCFVSSGWAKVEEATVARKPDYEWRQTDSSLALLNRDKVVWQLNFDKKEGKPYFHPVGLADGTELTWLRPADHRWHRALWFSWKFINGVNYWEEDPTTGLSLGRTEVVEVKVAPHNDRSGDIEMMLSYHRPGQESVLTEKRLIAVSVPGEDGRYHIDFYSKFTAGDKDVVLSRTPIPGEQGGKGWGGYAGLSVRMAKATRRFQFVDSEGRKDKQAHGKKARWVDFSGELPDGKEAGITIFDHPDNLRHPSPWYVEKGMPYFSPAVLFNKPYKIEAKKSLTLWYRILIHPGWVDKKTLERECEAFLKTTDIDLRFESVRMLFALGVAMFTYSGDSEVKFPDDMFALHKYGNLKKKDLEWLLENVMYLGKGKTDITIWPNTVLAYDKALLAKGKGTNVLFGDMSVAFKTPEQLERFGIQRSGEGKTAIKVDLLVCEVIEDVEIDWETAVEIKNIVGEEKGLSPAVILKSAVGAKHVAKDKLESLVDLLNSKGYLKILLNPTLEVLTGNTAKVRSSSMEPTGKEIVDSFAVKPLILDDGYIDVATIGIFENKPMSSLRNRIRDGQSFISGSVRKKPSGPGEPATETIFIVTAAISKGD